MRARLAWALSLTAALLLGSVHAQEPATSVISDIRQESADDSTRLVVVSNGPLTYTYYSPDPLTLIVDLPDVDIAKVPSKLSVGTSEVESLRITPMARGEGRTLARLEVRLARRVPYSIYSKDRTLNLVFERVAEARNGAPASRPAAPAAPAPVVVADTAAPAETKPTVTTPPTAEPLVGSAGETVIVPGPHVKASRVLAVTHEEENGQLSVTVKADGRLRYQDFFLGNPDRLVIDLKDVSSGRMRTIDVKSEPVNRVRLNQFSDTPKVTRVVLDLSRRMPYRVLDTADGLKVVFGEGESAGPAPLAALRSDTDPDAAPLSEPSGGSAMLTAVPVLAAPAPAPEPQVASETFEPRTVGPGTKKYTGHPISLDFKDGDLQDIFRLFADISGLNVVVNPGVSGKVTLKLNEVPWDQALDLILKTNGLGYTLEDNVIRIAPLSALQREEQERAKLAHEKELAGDLVTWRKPLSYARAEALEATVKKVALSERGIITLDARTNTMILTDLPNYIEKAKDLILDLDRATPQVEIEARIVVTTRNFTRELGIQWGFMNQMTPRYGNTTGLNYPNSIILNGGGVAPSQNASGLPADTGGGVASDAGIGVAGRGYAVNLPATAVNSALGLSTANIAGNFNLDLALTALESRGRGRILSTPKVTTQNNQEAEIKQGIQIAVTNFSPAQGNMVTFKDVVLTLKVTPQITEAGTVILGLSVENNSADFSRAVNNVPPINIQSVKTQVLVVDGSTAVIGGIYQQTEQASRNQTPLFGDLPIIGYLFRNKAIRSENTELLVFITPRIVKG